ncbi:phosphatase PAP2-related protein [Flavitalea flava]
MPQKILLAIREEWKEAWQSAGFRRKMITGAFLVALILSAFPYFFQFIEKRNGFNLNDPFMRWLPPYNVSLVIFIIIWALSLLVLYRLIRNPATFLAFLWAYAILLLLRMLMITLVPLNPPVGLVGLQDPISNFFYGKNNFVTKDLFFSGHTSSVFLIYLFLTERREKQFALFVTAAVGFLLMVQHVHYTLDVLGALFFAWLARWIAFHTVVRHFHKISPIADKSPLV